MLSLLKEYSKKSPYQSRFDPARLGAEFRLKGMRFELPGGKYCVIVESRFVILVILVSILYFFAVETANDWIYLIAGGGIAAVALGAFLPFAQVSDIDLSCAMPADHVAGDRLRVRVKLTKISAKLKISRFFPAKWIVARIVLRGSHDEHSILNPITVDTIQTEAWVVAQSPPLARGVYRMEKLEIYSSFPFGLLWWSRIFDVASKTRVDNPIVTAYPRISGIEGNFLYRLRASGTTALFSSASRVASAMPSSSVRSLREFVTGDSPRLIHWASSAKTGKLLVREFDSEGLPAYDVLVDLTEPWSNQEQFELAISLANSLLHMGFKMGGGPELYLIPSPHDKLEDLPICLQDMPNMPPGIGRWSQLLARVEAVIPKNPEYNVPIPDMGAENKMALLAVRPAAPPDDLELSGSNPQLSIDSGWMNRVDVWVLSRAFTQPSTVEEKAESWILGQRKVLPAHAGFSERRGSGSGPAGRILCSLSTYEDISRL